MPKYFRYRCRDCRRDFTLKTGTIFEDSPLGLDKWLPAMWLIANCKNGISSYEIARDLDVEQRTAWFMLHRIRHAMKSGSFDKMEGTVEADETFIGGKERNKHNDKKLRQGRGTVGKTIVQGVLERGEGGRKSRVAAKVVKDTTGETLKPNVQQFVEVGSWVYTDAHRGYTGLNAEFVHEFIDHSVRYADGVVHTNGMENFWSLLKRGLSGTYVSVMPFHLERYVDEQGFRFNERGQTDGERFLTVLSQVSGKRLTWKELTNSFEDFYGPIYQYG
ncbi:MAG: IS1595 family transposase [Capsulimonadaceae bacterium]